MIPFELKEREHCLHSAFLHESFFFFWFVWWLPCYTRSYWKHHVSSPVTMDDKNTEFNLTDFCTSAMDHAHVFLIVRQHMSSVKMRWMPSRWVSQKHSGQIEEFRSPFRCFLQWGRFSVSAGGHRLQVLHARHGIDRNKRKPVHGTDTHYRIHFLMSCTILKNFYPT